MLGDSYGYQAVANKSYTFRNKLQKKDRVYEEKSFFRGYIIHLILLDPFQTILFMAHSKNLWQASVE